MKFRAGALVSTLALLLLTAGPAFFSPPPAQAAADGCTSGTTTTRSDIIFNPCADLDWTGWEDCRSGHCYGYCWTGTTMIWCQKDLNFVTVHVWKKYRLGQPPRGCHTTFP